MRYWFTVQSMFELVSDAVPTAASVGIDELACAVWVMVALFTIAVLSIPM